MASTSSFRKSVSLFLLCVCVLRESRGRATYSTDGGHFTPKSAGTAAVPGTATSAATVRFLQKWVESSYDWSKCGHQDTRQPMGSRVFKPFSPASMEAAVGVFEELKSTFLLNRSDNPGQHSPRRAHAHAVRRGYERFCRQDWQWVREIFPLYNVSTTEEQQTAVFLAAIKAVQEWEFCIFSDDSAHPEPQRALLETVAFARQELPGIFVDETGPAETAVREAYGSKKMDLLYNPGVAGPMVEVDGDDDRGSRGAIAMVPVPIESARERPLGARLQKQKASRGPRCFSALQILSCFPSTRAATPAIFRPPERGTKNRSRRSGTAECRLQEAASRKDAVSRLQEGRRQVGRIPPTPLVHSTPRGRKRRHISRTARVRRVFVEESSFEDDSSNGRVPNN